MNPKDQDALVGSVQDLLDDYYSFNTNQCEILYEEPTPLEFMRYVARNRSFVVKAGAASWPAVQKWSKAYLVESIGKSLVNAAVTPYGNADAPLEREDGGLWFVKPLEQEMQFEQVMQHVTAQEAGEHVNGPVIYAQTQNDNLRGEYEQLFADVPKTIPFAKIALEKEPDAINFWLGNSRSTTALHKDPYENIYVQIRGSKHFILLPPHAAACVNTQPLPAATYLSNTNGSKDQLASDLEAFLDEPCETVPFPTWDPDLPDTRPTQFSPLCQPIRVTLDAGDMLYLPALWYHKVAQSCGEEGFCCAVNYWFDMDYSGSFYPLCSFARAIGDLAISHKT